MTNGLKIRAVLPPLGSDAKLPEQLCNAVVVAVGLAYNGANGFDLGHAVCHHGSNAGLFQHGAVVLAVAHGKGVLVLDAQQIGKGQQGAAFVHTGGAAALFAMDLG